MPKSQSKRKKRRLPTTYGSRAPGPQTAYRPEFDDTARELCLLGMTNAQIAEYFGVTERTIDNWKSRFPTFRVNMRAGKMMANANVGGSLYKRAIGYEHEAVEIFLRQGAEKPVIVPYLRRYPPDTNAARFWLMNRQPERWRDRQKIVANDPLAAMTPEQRLAQVLEIMAKARAILAEPDPEDEDGGSTKITDAEPEEK